jgi:hypothetical protein
MLTFNETNAIIDEAKLVGSVSCDDSYFSVRTTNEYALVSVFDSEEGQVIVNKDGLSQMIEALKQVMGYDNETSKVTVSGLNESSFTKDAAHVIFSLDRGLYEIYACDSLHTAGRATMTRKEVKKALTVLKKAIQKLV